MQLTTKTIIALCILSATITGCSTLKPEIVAHNPATDLNQNYVEQARQLFSKSAITDARVVDRPNESGVQEIQSIGPIDGEKNLVVRLEGDLEWPLPYDRAGIGGEVRGKYAIMLFDKETGRFTYIKLSREKL